MWVKHKQLPAAGGGRGRGKGTWGKGDAGEGDTGEGDAELRGPGLGLAGTQPWLFPGGDGVTSSVLSEAVGSCGEVMEGCGGSWLCRVPGDSRQCWGPAAERGEQWGAPLCPSAAGGTGMGTGAGSGSRGDSLLEPLDWRPSCSVYPNTPPPTPVRPSTFQYTPAQCVAQRASTHPSVPQYSPALPSMPQYVSAKPSVARPAKAPRRRLLSSAVMSCH